MEKKAYAAGTITCKLGDLEGVVAGLNYLRSGGMAVEALRGSESGNEVSIPVILGSSSKIPLDSGKDALNEDLAIMRRVLDCARVSVGEVVPVSSDPKTLRLARRADSIKPDGAMVTMERILPKAESNPFSGLVGMDKTVSLARGIADAAALFGRESLESLHMVLKGTPGCGKTEFASRLATYLGQVGVTDGGIVMVSAPELISPHVGETPHFVSDAFDRAAGGVLFIDEAYSLSDGGGNDFGIEAVNALTLRMDERRQDVVVIAAGYPKEMDAFLSSNPGLRNRFGFEVDMPDLKNEDLVKVFGLFAEKRGIAVEPDVFDRLPRYIDGLREGKDFAGARSVRKLFVRSLMNVAQEHPSNRSILLADVRAQARKLAMENAPAPRMGY